MQPVSVTFLPPEQRYLLYDNMAGWSRPEPRSLVIGQQGNRVLAIPVQTFEPKEAAVGAKSQVYKLINDGQIQTGLHRLNLQA